MAGVTVGERVLVHLSGYLRFLDAYECPAEMTQDGIAAGLGLSRAHVALELKRLRSSGRVEERMAHVASAKTRRKVYVLTPSGQELARRMRDHARTRTTILAGPHGTQEVSGERALELLKARGLRESEILQKILAGAVIDLAPPAVTAEAPAIQKPFFGRLEEVRVLRNWLASGAEPVAVVVGVAGIGKTAILGHALDGEARPTFVRRLYPHDDAHGIFASCADFLARQGRRRLKALVSRPAYDPIEALAVLREDLAGCVVSFDDLHACPAAEGVFRSLIETPTSAKILVASRVQPTFYDRSAVASRRVLEVSVRGLGPEASAALLASRRPALDAADAGRVLDAAQGHPLSLELFAASGLDVGRVEAERFIVETVLDGLDGVPEGVLKAFAILRRPAKSPEALGATVIHVRRLLQRTVLQHREDGYLLHDLVKEFYVRRLDAQQAKAVHARAARYWAGRGDILEAAFHRIEAGEARAAAGLLAGGGEPYAEGARAGDLESCLLRLPADLRPLKLLATTQAFLGKFEESKRAWQALSDRGTSRERLYARIQLGRIENRLGSHALARDILRQVVDDAAGDRELEGEALRALGGAERRLGELPEAIVHLRRAVDLLDTNARERARARLDLGAALLSRKDLAAARMEFEEAARLVRPGSREAAAVENNLAIVLSHEGRIEEAARAFERSAEWALGSGEMRFAAQALANAADNLVRLGRTDEAESCASRALELARSIGDPVALSTAQANLGLVYAHRGEFGRAEAELIGSLEPVARLENPYTLASRYDEIARVVEAQGRVDDATSWRTRATDLFARLHAEGVPIPPAGSVGQPSDKIIK